MQKSNKISQIILFSFLVCCIISCKNSKGPVDPVVDVSITYEPSSAIFPNPERGFMHTRSVYSEGQSLNLADLKLLRGNNISLILRVFYLEKFKNQPISAPELLLIQTDLDKIREVGLKGILRFAYTDDLNGSDAPLSIVERHLDQLKPVFELNKDVIAFVQAGFIGAWGEWHHSSNELTSLVNQQKVLNKLLSVLPVDIMIQVRTPAIKKNIFNTILPITKDIAYTAESQARVGHHNDCFLTGGTNYGTYQDIAVDKQYISSDALYVPTGGETCPPEAGYSPNCAAGRTEMQLLKWTYLNLDWYQPTITAWKNSGCYDEFQRSLGYRLALVKANFPKEITAKASFKVNITITNTGYAPLYNKKNAYLVLKNKISGQFKEVALSIDLRNCKPSGTLIIDETVSLTSIPSGVYDLYLRIADSAESLKSISKYAIRLANKDVWVEDNGGMNDLKWQLKVL